MKWIKVFNNIEEAYAGLKQKQIRKVITASSSFCITLIDDQFYAFSPLCPHQKEPLQKGKINDFGEIICPLHEYRFSLKTGTNTHGNCGPLARYQTKVTEEGAVLVYC